MRYEKHSTIITTNYNIKDWNKIFPDSYNELDAMLDRFLHHVQIVTINGKSYRRRDLSEYWSEQWQKINCFITNFPKANL